MNTTITTQVTTTARTVRHSLGLAALAVPMAAAITLGAGTAAHAESEPMPTTPTAWSATTADPEVVPNPDIPEGPGDLEVETPCWETDTCPVPEDPETNPAIPEGPGDLEVETPCWQTDTCPVPEDDDEDEDGPVRTNPPTCEEEPVVLDEPLEPAPSDEDGPMAEDAGDGPVRTNPEGPVRTNPDEDGDGPVRTNPPEEEDCDDEGEPGGGDGSGTDDGFDKPTRIDAGSAFGDNGLQLAWLLPGGLLVSAGGMAFASRRLRGEPR